MIVVLVYLLVGVLVIFAAGSYNLRHSGSTYFTKPWTFAGGVLLWPLFASALLALVLVNVGRGIR